MNRLAAAVAGSALVVLSACKSLDAPDQNASTLQDLSGSPTQATLFAAAQGLLAGVRASGPCTGNCAYIGREGMNLDPSNPQTVPTIYSLGGDLAVWATPYANDKLANLILAGVGKAVPALTAGQVSAISGFTKTIKAVDLMFVIQTTDQTGAVLDVPTNVTDPIPAVATRAAVYARIFQLLDDGFADLNTAGATPFPFTFPAGFTGFTTPATFKYFNRAIKAREQVYFASSAADYTAALATVNAALTGGPFSAAPASLANLNVGVYNTYSLTAGDLTNGVYDATDRQRFAHTVLAAEAQLQPGYAVLADTATKRDDRFLRKVRPVKPQALNRYNFDVFWAYQVYNSLSDPIPLIRDEELILLRAEAELGSGDRASALADINSIRTLSGKLAALGADPGLGGTRSGDLLLDDLLYNKRYSLVWEGGYSWFDARKYGTLASLNHGESDGLLTPGGVAVQNGTIAGQVVFQFARLPDNECNARGMTINATPAGSGGPCQLAAGK